MQWRKGFFMYETKIFGTSKIFRDWTLYCRFSNLGEVTAMITPGCDGGAHPGHVTCLASTLEECPLVTYMLDSGLPFREHGALWLISEGTLRDPRLSQRCPLRGTRNVYIHNDKSCHGKFHLCRKFFAKKKQDFFRKISHIRVRARVI